MLEKEFESKMTDIVKSLGGLCVKFESPGNTGVPDRLVIGTHGNIYFVEMKRPSQSRTAAKQNYWKDKLTKHGCKSFIIHNEEELDKFLRLLKIDERQDPSLRHYIYIACKRKDLHGKEKKELFLEGEVIKETSKQIVVKCSDDGLEYTIRKTNIRDFKKWTVTR